MGYGKHMGFYIRYVAFAVLCIVLRYTVYIGSCYPHDEPLMSPYFEGADCINLYGTRLESVFCFSARLFRNFLLTAIPRPDLLSPYKKRLVKNDKSHLIRPK